MADLQAIKDTLNILQLVEADLGSPGQKSGRWHLWRCPFHTGARQDLAVTPDDGTFYCFGCGKSGDALTWLLDYRKMTWKDILTLPVAGPGALTAARPAPRPAADEPPGAAWQARGMAFVASCEKALWAPGGAGALAYLREQRGLTDETIQRYRLGYNQASEREPRETWGLASDPDSKPVWLPRGVVIPYLIRGALWGINIRQPQGDPKYIKIPGSKGALFGADNLPGADIVLLTEGEFDCILASQELGDVAGVATLGSASKRLNLATWGADLLPAKTILAAYDPDQAGSKGAAVLADLSTRIHPVKVPRLNPGDKDLTDYKRAGGDLWGWLRYNLEKLGALPGDLPPVFPWPEGAETLTVRWPADSKFPTVAGAWYREDDGRIVATYTQEQMDECVTVAYAWGMLPAGIAWSTSGAAG